VSESQWKQDREMATADEQQDPRIARISSAIRVIPDFPKPGNYKVCLYCYSVLCLFVFYPLLIDLCLVFIVFFPGGDRDYVSGYNNVAS
jgi:hypothetical protein